MARSLNVKWISATHFCACVLLNWTCHSMQHSGKRSQSQEVGCVWHCLLLVTGQGLGRCWFCLGWPWKDLILLSGCSDAKSIVNSQGGMSLSVSRSECPSHVNLSSPVWRAFWDTVDKDTGCHVSSCDFFTCVYCCLLLYYGALFKEQISELVCVQADPWWADPVLQSTAWDPGLLSAQQEVGHQATLGFMYKQKQRRGDIQCTLQSTGSLIFLQGMGLGLTKTPVSLTRWPGICERAQVGRKSLLGRIWTVVLFI